MDDEMMLENIAFIVLEREAERLVADLVAADAAARTVLPDLLAELDRNAAEAHDTWEANLHYGDLPCDHRVEEVRLKLGDEARYQMAHTLLGWEAGEHDPQRFALWGAVGAVYSWLRRLGDDNDTWYYLGEYIAEHLGEIGPRYLLGAC